MSASRTRKSRRLLIGTALLAASLSEAAPSADAVATDLVDALYANDAPVREQARRQLLAAGTENLGQLDPRRSPCLGTGLLPPQCRHHAAFLAGVLDILTRLSATETATAALQHPARDLLFALVSDPAVDAFDGPALDPDRAAALRRQAERALRAAMVLPIKPTRAAAAAAAVAGISSSGHQWFVLQVCAGESQYAACRYGSYLYNPEGRLLSAGVIELGAPDNPGAGIDEWRLELRPASGLPQRGVAFTRGGFGGDVDRVELRQLTPRLRALCGLKLPRTPGGPEAADLMHALDHHAGVCGVNPMPLAATLSDHTRPVGAASSRTKPKSSHPAPAPQPR